MDDPTRWCENDASNGTRLPWAPDPKRGPLFFWRGPEFHRLVAVRCALQFIRRYEDRGTVPTIPGIVDLGF
jgi:hypothetical protein